MHNLFNIFNLSVVIVIAAIGFIYGLIRHKSADLLDDGPILASANMLNVGGLTSLNQGTIAGFSYNILSNDNESVMFLVQLGRDTELHLVAYGDKSRLDPIVVSSMSRKWLEPVSLEGDFPEYFHMYITPEMQVEIRQIFTPDIMANFADFCRAYDLEIYHESLYISQSNGARDAQDRTSLATDLEIFLQKNSMVFQNL